MKEANLRRETIIESLVAALEPLSYTHAAWQAGAAAFNRLDQWSDIDFMVDVDDDRVGDTFAVIDRTLARLSPIDLMYELPEPTWHGHAQRFYRLEKAGPFLTLDLVVLRHSLAEKFLEPEIHGQAVVHFDKDRTTLPPPFDPGAMQKHLRSRLATLRTTFDLFQTLTIKELERGNWLEALAFYQGYTLRPLVEALRIRHAPARSSFYLRYAYYDLPPEIVQRLERLFFVEEAASLGRLRAEAEAWFFELLAELEAAMAGE